LLSKTKNRTFTYQPRFSTKTKTTISSTDDTFVSGWTKEQKKSRKSRTTISIKVLLLVIGIIVDWNLLFRNFYY
jgi:hypothetical protein